MTDRRVDDDLDEDRLPWLEAVEEEERGPSPVKLIAMVVIGLIAIGILVGGLFWLGNRGSGGGEELIASPGEYKVPAPEPGGMKVDNSSSSQVATSDGSEQTSSVSQGARPEAPVNQPQQQLQSQPQSNAAQPKAAPAPAQPQQPRPQAPAQPQAQRLSGPMIQVGAYDSAERAEAEWRRLSQRFSDLRALPHAVTTIQRGGRTYYRLRAAGENAQAVCRRLVSAGQPCFPASE
jgi:hypothetical protein